MSEGVARSVARAGNADPRAELVAQLAAGAARMAAAGDLEGARVAHDAIGRLLGLADGRAGVDVVDLAAERARRGPR